MLLRVLLVAGNSRGHRWKEGGKARSAVRGSVLFQVWQEDGRFLFSLQGSNNPNELMCVLVLESSCRDARLCK